MSAVVADSNALLWSVFDRPRLSAAALAVLTAAEQGGGIHISTITLVELTYLTGKKSFPYPAAFAQVRALLANPAALLQALPLTEAVALAVGQIPRAEVPDMPDRLIAATAVAHGLPVVSADADLRGSAALQSLVPVVW